MQSGNFSEKAISGMKAIDKTVKKIRRIMFFRQDVNLFIVSPL